MKKFSGKYEMLAEVALTRYQQSGFLIGDYVRIKKNALNNEKIKGMSDQYKDRIKQFQNSDVNLRICAVKNKYPDSSFGVVGSPDMPIDSFVDVVQEISLANWVNPMTIPMDAVELVETEFYAPIPDSVKRPSPEPTEFDDKGVAKGDMGAEEATRMSKELNLATKNTKLANSNKWQDDKPGAGNTKGVTKPKKLNDSVKVDDEKMLVEAYTSIYQEAGVPAQQPAQITDQDISTYFQGKTPEEINKIIGTLKDPRNANIFRQKYGDIDALIGRIQKATGQGAAPQAAAPQAAAPAPTPAVASSEEQATAPTAPTAPTATSETPEQADAAMTAFRAEPGIDDQPHEPLTAQGVMNQQERRPDDQRFAALMDLRKQQMANDQQNTQDRIWQQGQRSQRGRDRDAGYDAYQQSQWQQPEQMQPWDGQNTTGNPYNTPHMPYNDPRSNSNPVTPRGYVDPMRSSPTTQSQDWEGGSQNFGGQLGNILQNTGLNTAEGAGNGLANSIGGAVGNVVGAAGEGAANRVYDWAGGNNNPARNDSRYNPSNQGGRSQSRPRGGSRYQSGAGQPRNR